MRITVDIPEEYWLVAARIYGLTILYK